MKKSTLHFGEFKQYDKVFITADKGIDGASVTSVAFSGNTLYIASAKGTFEYSEGNLKKLSFNASKLISVKGTLYASIGNSLAEIKKGKAKKIAEFGSKVVDVSVALDGSVWLITENHLYLMNDGEIQKIFGLPSETV